MFSHWITYIHMYVYAYALFFRQTYTLRVYSFAVLVRFAFHPPWRGNLQRHALLKGVNLMVKPHAYCRSIIHLNSMCANINHTVLCFEKVLYIVWMGGDWANRLQIEITDSFIPTYLLLEWINDWLDCFNFLFVFGLAFESLVKKPKSTCTAAIKWKSNLPRVRTRQRPHKTYIGTTLN